MMIESFEKHGSGRRSLSWNLVHLKPAGKFESLVQFVVMSNLKTLSIHNANFEFCDKYNSYALNRFRSVADDWLTVEDPGDYVATVAVIENVAEVRSLGSQTILRQDVYRMAFSVSLSFSFSFFLFLSLSRSSLFSCNLSLSFLSL